MSEEEIKKIGESLIEKTLIQLKNLWGEKYMVYLSLRVTKINVDEIKLDENPTIN